MSSVNAESGPQAYRRKYMQEMKTRLSLDGDQASRIEAILDDTRNEYRGFYSRHKEEMDAIQKDQTRRINEVLSPEQQTEYARLRKEREERRKTEKR